MAARAVTRSSEIEKAGEMDDPAVFALDLVVAKCGAFGCEFLRSVGWGRPVFTGNSSFLFIQWTSSKTGQFRSVSVSFAGESGFNAKAQTRKAAVRDAAGSEAAAAYEDLDTSSFHSAIIA